ncbi:MAG: YdcF family protein [Propionibacteriaceae bacterium]|nr:YdcF family protein [Propionibacteriaceae bacterium]
MSKHPARRVVVSFLVVLALLLCLAVGIPSFVVWLESHSRMHSIDDVSARDVTLVMGAAMESDRPSAYLQKRLDVAAALYAAGKTKVIIVSGTRDGGYSEPDGMKTALVAAGVPASQIVPDYLGNDTFSSCARARDVFGVTSLIVVSQTYHLPRAIASCQMQGVDAVGVGDDTINHDLLYWGYRVRELAGEMKLTYDVVTHRSVPYEAPSDAVQQALAGS